MTDFKVRAGAVDGSCVIISCNDYIGFDLVAFGFEKFFQVSINRILVFTVINIVILVGKLTTLSLLCL